MLLNLDTALCMIADASVDMEKEPFPSDGDILDFLLQTAEIRTPR